MSALDLLLSRKALAAGVGLTTRRNKVLPFSSNAVAIPARIGMSARPVAAAEDTCLLGPIIESYMAARTYHADETVIRSADYIWHIVVKHLNRVRCTQNGVGTGSDIDLYFSSPATPAATTIIGGTDSIAESAYTTRTYHPEVLVAPIASRGAMMHMVMERFNGVEMNRHGSPFVWSFAKVGGTVLTGVYNACVNRASGESNIASRTYHATYKGVTKFVMQNNAKFWDLRPAEYGGLLGPSNYANGPALTDVGFVNTYLEGGSVQVGSMARIKAMGQPFHGLININLAAGVVSTVNITLPDSTVKTLPNGGFYLQPTALMRRWMGNTYYFKHPAAPTPTTPTSVAAVSGVFYNDAVFYGYDRGYALNGYGLNPGPYAVGNYDGDWLVVADNGDVLRSTMNSSLISGSSYNLKFKTFGKIRPADLARSGGGLNRNNTSPVPSVISATDSGVNLPVTLNATMVWANHPSPDGRKIIVSNEDTAEPTLSKFWEVTIDTNGLATSYAAIPATGIVKDSGPVRVYIDDYHWPKNTSETRSVEFNLFATYAADGSRIVGRMTCGWQYISYNYGIAHPYGKHLQTWNTWDVSIGGGQHDLVYVDIDKAVVTLDDGTTWTCPEFYEPVIVPYTNNVVGMKYKDEALVERVVFIAPGIVSAPYPWLTTYSVTYNPRLKTLHVSNNSNLIYQCT